MWWLYRFTRETGAAGTRVLDTDARAFAQAIVQETPNQAIWVEATARAADGGIDVWFSLPALPTGPPLAPKWRDELRACGLAARRITNRA